MAQNSTYTRRINLFINGVEVKNNIKDIKGAMSKLINEQAKMTIGSKEYLAHAQKIQTLNGILQKHRNDISATGEKWKVSENSVSSYKKKLGEVEKSLNSLEVGSTRYNKKLQEYNDILRKIEAHELSLKKAKNNYPTNSISAYKSKLDDVRKSLESLTVGTREYNNRLKEYNTLKAKLTTHESNLKGETEQIDKNGNAWTRLSGSISKYWGVAVGLSASFAGLVMGANKANDAFLELDEKQADVMKTTGLTREQVKGLNSELAKIDTRTSQLELLDLARVAGKLGITAQDEIAGFVRASDQISVALKEDLGGDVEEAVNQLGKLVDVFKLNKEFGMEESLLKVGSAINSLGAAGTANEGYLVEFAKRVGGIAPMAGVSMSKVLGLGATLDELGQTAEVSGTTYTQIMGAMFKDTGTFAKMAGMKIGEFTNLLNTDANEAFIKVLEGTKGTSGGFAEMAGNLDKMGLDGARSTAVLGVLANNIDKLRDRQAYANEEFEKGSSLTEEYATKQETATAKLEKAKKEVTALAAELGQKLNPYMTYTNLGFAKFLKLIMGAPAWIKENQTLLLALGAALLAYNAKLITSTALKIKDKAISLGVMAMEKANLVMMGVKAAAMQVQIALTGKATVAQLRYIATAKAMGAMVNPWQLVLIAVSAAVIAYKAFSSEQSKLNKGFAETAAKIDTERRNMNALFDVVKKSKEGTQERAAAIKLLNEKYGEYLPKLLTEKSSLKEIEAAQKGANNELVRSIAIKSQQEAIEQTVNDSLEKKKKLYEQIARKVRYSSGDDKATVATGAIGDYVKRIIETKAKEGANSKAYFAIIKEFAEKYNVDYYEDAWKLDDIAKVEQEVEKSVTKINTMYTSMLGPLNDVKEAQSDLNKEQIADNIGTDSLEDLTSKLKQYQLALKDTKEGSEEYLRIQGKIAEVRSQMAKLKPATPTGGGNAPGNKEPVENEEDKLIKQKQQEKIDAAEGLAKTIKEIRAQLRLDTLSEEDKEREKVKAKYADALAMAEQHGLDTTELKQLQEEELTALEKKFDADRLKAKQDAQAKLDEFWQSQHGKELSDFEREKADKIAQYQTMLAMAEENGLATTEQYQLLKEELDAIMVSEEPRDLFGMTEDDWDVMYAKFEKAMEYLDQIGSIWNSVNQIQANKEQKAYNQFEKNTENKKKLLQDQLNSGAISQEAYDSKVAALDAELDKKKAEIDRNQAERTKKVALFNIAVSTAQAIMRIWGDTPKVDWGVGTAILTGLAIAAGAAQAAVVMSAPAEFAKGGFTSGDKIYAGENGRKFRAGEKGTEWVGSNNLVNDPYTGPVIAALESVQRGSAPASIFADGIVAPAFGEMTDTMPRFAKGGFTNDTASQPATVVAQQSIDLTPLTSGINALVEENRQLRQYMSDPENRRAFIDETSLVKRDKERVQRNSFGRIE